MGTGHQGWGHMVSPREARSSGSVECGQLDACAWKCEKCGVGVGAMEPCENYTCLWTRTQGEQGQWTPPDLFGVRGTVGEPYYVY